MNKSPSPVFASSAAIPRGPAGLASAVALGGTRAAATFAALDLGTNNCRLLVARPAGSGFRVIDAFSRIVRLGEGLALTGRLSEAAMARSLEALKVCAAKVAHRGVTHIRAVATEACRRASNCAGFLERVEATTGLAIEIISTEEEARLAVAGCASLLDRSIPYALVFDIGGGSTELVWLRLGAGGRPEILGFTSLPLGVVNVTERYRGDPLPPETYDAMVGEVEAAILPFAERHGIAEHIAAGRVQMLGSSGTVTTLAGVHLGLPRYNRAVVDGSTLSFAAIGSVSSWLARSSYAVRAAHPCVGTERADLVVAGCAILDAICTLWPVGRLKVADRGVREGILMDLLAEVAR